MTVCKTTCGTKGLSKNLWATFQKPAAKRNRYNEIDPRNDTATAAGGAYVSVESGPGRELYYANQNHSDVSAVIKADWATATKDIDADHQIVVNGSTYEILFASNRDEQNEEMVWGCRKLVT